MTQVSALWRHPIKGHGRGVTDTDDPSISLLNLACNADLAARVGAEFDLVGRTLRIGGAELQVRESIRRCMATTANPATGARDLDTLAALNTNWNHQDFGIYAEVSRTGAIVVGAPVEVL